MNKNNNPGAFNDPNFTKGLENLKGHAETQFQHGVNNSGTEELSLAQSIMDKVAGAAKGGDHKAAVEHLKEYVGLIKDLRGAQRAQIQDSLAASKEEVAAINSKIKALNDEIKIHKKAGELAKKGAIDAAEAVKKELVAEKEKIKQKQVALQETDRLNKRAAQAAQETANKISRTERERAKEQDRNESRESYQVVKGGYMRAVANSGLASGTHRYGRALAMESLEKVMAGGGGGSMLGGLGGMAMGGGLMLAGAAVSAVVSKVWENVQRSVQTAIKESDVGKSGAAAGQNSYDFRTELRTATAGYGVTIEEEAAYAERMRQIMGRQQEWGGFGNVMRNGVMMGRAFGTDPGMMSEWTASLVRHSGTGASSLDQNKLATTFAEALGRGRLIGLQEEMMKGITDLVELTRQNNLAGPSATMYADLIANVSQIGGGLKNLKGQDAARMIGNMSQGLANPSDEFGYVVSMRSLRKTLANAKDEKGNRLVSDEQLNDLPFMREKMAQGVGLSINKDGKTYNLGQERLSDSLETALSLSGGDKGMASMALANRFFGGSYEAARIALENRQMFNAKDEGMGKIFGTDQISQKTLQNVGSVRFIANLGEAYNSNGKDANAAFETAYKNLMETSPERDKELYQKAYDQSSGKTVQERVQAIADVGAQLSSATPEDEIRRALTDIDRYMQKLTDAVVPFTEWLIGFFRGGSKASEGDKARAAYIAAEKEREKQMQRDISKGKGETFAEFDEEKSNRPLLEAISQAEQGTKDWGGKMGVLNKGIGNDEGYVNVGFANLSGKGGYKGNGQETGRLGQFLETLKSNIIKGDYNYDEKKKQQMLADLEAVKGIEGNEADLFDYKSTRGSALSRLASNGRKEYVQDVLNHSAGPAMQKLGAYGVDASNMKNLVFMTQLMNQSGPNMKGLDKEMADLQKKGMKGNDWRKAMEEWYMGRMEDFEKAHEKDKGYKRGRYIGAGRNLIATAEGVKPDEVTVAENVKTTEQPKALDTEKAQIAAATAPAQAQEMTVKVETNENKTVNGAQESRESDSNKFSLDLSKRNPTGFIRKSKFKFGSDS